MAEDVLLFEREGALAVVTLNRPKQKNALDPELLAALHGTLRRLSDDPAVRTIVLTGAGGAFCSGADLKAAMAAGPSAFETVDQTLDVYHAVIRSIVGAPQPVVAMVDGPAVGFGCDLALACDLRFCSTGAYFQERFVKIGLMPDGGGTFWLPRLVGLARAMEIMLTGRSVGADEALGLGMINRVVAPDALRGETLAFARELAKGPPLAHAAIKRAVRAGLGGTVDTALDAEKAGQLGCLRSGDFLEGIMAWMEKRAPAFQGK